MIDRKMCKHGEEGAAADPSICSACVHEGCVYLTRREVTQLIRAAALLERYHDRRAEALGIEGDLHDDDPLWDAWIARARMCRLIENNPTIVKKA